MQRTLRKAQRLAHLLDNAFRIPGTRWRIGWDSLIGLVPGVGDAVTGAVALWIVLEARRLGAPRVLQTRMLWNLLLDVAGGTVPLIGDIFDAGFKANLKNVALLENLRPRRRCHCQWPMSILNTRFNRCAHVMAECLAAAVLSTPSPVCRSR